MTAHLVDGIDILLWPHPTGLSAFAAPFVSVDRYRVLDGPARARILKCESLSVAKEIALG